MVYYLRASPLQSRLDSSSESSSEPQSTPDVDSDKLMEKYGPSFMYSLFALCFTFVLCHLLVRLSCKTFSFLCKKDKDGNIMYSKHGNAYICHRHAWMASAIVGGVVLLSSLAMAYNKE